MTVARRYFRLSSVALAAIVGMLSVTGEAAACSAKGAGKAMGACCAAPVRSACCCDQFEPRPASTDRTVVGMPSGTDRLLAPDSPCECRTGGPSEPAPKPQSPTSEHRTDQDRAPSFEPIVEFRPTPILLSLVPPTESPPGVPLYLRASRLLI